MTKPNILYLFSDEHSFRFMGHVPEEAGGEPVAHADVRPAGRAGHGLHRRLLPDAAVHAVADLPTDRQGSPQIRRVEQQQRPAARTGDHPQSAGGRRLRDLPRRQDAPGRQPAVRGLPAPALRRPDRQHRPPVGADRRRGAQRDARAHGTRRRDRHPGEPDPGRSGDARDRGVAARAHRRAPRPAVVAVRLVQPPALPADRAAPPLRPLLARTASPNRASPPAATPTITR